MVKTSYPNREDRSKVVIHAFDSKFTNFFEVAVAQAQTKHDAPCIKELRRCELEGKKLYEKCTMSFNSTKDIDEELKKKHDEVKALVD